MIIPPVTLADGIVMRPAVQTDAEALADAYVRNREHLAPTSPHRDESFFTAEGQDARLRDELAQWEAGRLVPWVLAGDGRILGTVTLSQIVLGPWRNANLGYWIDAGHLGRGLATRAARSACRAADEHLGLHRVAAGTLTDNVASQRVLLGSGFTWIGRAPDYLYIAGAWREHLIFQRILNERPAV
ncbi:GNAT family protein [Streptomyces luomodiensis]|uniref:GNAT family protein n=1 Tax=Streptomyces luomodiensis TaxID=3026192 RepID=A0ABY9UR88_9ACTN|nr:MULTISPECIES: GNAT family protein [unclassified Streptomyces]WAP54657.1 GNAT family protein [Streptomyces sp. S465]WNE95082.1 GNAT family protein [Streptomyces sp. SCA4-21]